MNAVLLADIEELVEQEELLEELTDSRVFVTGATGLIGSQVVLALAVLNERKNTNISIYAFVRSEEKAKAVFGEYMEKGFIIPVYGDINCPIVMDEAVDYIIHGASATSSKFFVEKPVETIDTALNGTRNLLEFAKEKQVKSVVYLSSLEVYGVPLTENGVVAETDYGYLDPLSVRSSYSEGKRMVECLCVAFAKEYGVPVKIARLSQTFGAGVEYNDGRVFAEFARCAMEKKDIVLHTMGRTLRTYCYTKDAVAAIFYVLLKGNVGEAYNVTNEDTAVTIAEMAQCVCDIFSDSGISVQFDVPEDLDSFGYNPEMVIRLDTKRLQELGWKPKVGLKDMYLRMVQSFGQ